MPECPEHLDEIAKIEWWHITGILQEMGLLTKCDCSALEIYCHTYSEWRKACDEVAKYGAVLVQRRGEIVEAKRNPHDVIREKSAASCVRLLAEFGLTPSSRSQVSVKKKQSAVMSRQRA